MSQEWASTMAAAPVGAGETFFDDNFVHVEIAMVTPANVDNDDPYLTWVDVTEHVITARWQEGAVDGRESRWPIGSCTIDCYDLVDELADFIDPDPATRLASGSLVRILMTNDADTVFRQFSGVIDTIQETHKLGPRTWRIQAYDVLYPSAGADQGTIWESVATGAELDYLIDRIYDLYLDLRFDWDIEATSDTAGAFDIGGSLHALQHRLADSYSCRLWAGRDGIVYVRPWDNVDATPATTVTDGDATGDVTAVHAQPTWSLTNARVASALRTTGLDLITPTPSVATTSVDLQAKNGYRADAVGWPKDDLLYELFAQGDAIVAGAADRYADELSLDRFDIDTVQNRESTSVVSLLRTVGAGDGLINFVPDKGSLGAVRLELMILGTQHQITRLHEVPRWNVSYFPKITAIEDL